MEHTDRETDWLNNAQTEVVTVTRQSLNALLPERTPAEWEEIRAELIARGYATCSVTGCGALVGPAFQREVPGLGRVALCPRVQIHTARLGPARHNALIEAFRKAAATPAEPETPADPQVVDIDAKRNGRKPVQA